MPTSSPSLSTSPGRTLQRKYALLIASLVCLSLVVSGALAVYMFSREHRTQLLALQQEKAAGAALRIELFMKDIEEKISFLDRPANLTRRQASEQLDIQTARLLRQVPAVTELTWIDPQGRELLAASRLRMDRWKSGIDHSGKPYFTFARRGAPYYSEVEFRKETEPYVTLAVPLADGGVAVAEVNLKFVWEVVSRIKSGRTGIAYVVDSEGDLIAHPDISLVLRKSNLAHLPQVRAAIGPGEPTADERLHFVRNERGEEVVSTHARVPGMNWTVFVELAREEALEPLAIYTRRAIVVLVASTLLALVAGLLLAQRMARPILQLQQGARTFASGDLQHRIRLSTGDELEALAGQLNAMADQLQKSYATLEERVAQRTSQAESASSAKTRFIAAASHDLRQPMHALSLYLSVLGTLPASDEARALIRNLKQCAKALDDLFNGLLDISRLDANTVAPDRISFPMQPLLQSVQVQFAPAAAAKGIELSVVRTRASAHSDPVLVERIVRNLVSNAVRYTRSGKVLVGCRRRGGRLLVQVLDTGPGIAQDQRELIFEEFYQVANPGRDRDLGLGLGLSIVRRLAALLGSEVTLQSLPGRGSCFSFPLPLGEAPAPTRADDVPAFREGLLAGSTVLLVDDEQMILDATRAVFERWGCRVIATRTGEAAIANLAAVGGRPDLLVCDYRLAGPQTGLDVIERVRDEFNEGIPALLVTGDAVRDAVATASEGLVEVLHKPLSEAALYAAATAVLARAREAHVVASG